MIRFDIRTSVVRATVCKKKENILLFHKSFHQNGCVSCILLDDRKKRIVKIFFMLKIMPGLMLGNICEALNFWVIPISGTDVYWN